MNAHPRGDRSGAPLLGQPHRERLGEARAGARRQLLQRGQLVPGELGGQDRIGAQQQLAGAVAGGDQARLGPAERQRRPGAVEADRCLGPAHGDAQARPRARLVDRALQRSAAPGALGVGDDRAGELPDRLGHGIGGQTRHRAIAMIAGDGEDGERARQRPACLARRALDRRGLGRRLAHEQAHEPAPVELGLAGRHRLLARVPLGRLAAQHVDVGEDRLGEQVERVGLEAGLHPDGGKPPPGHPGPRRDRRSAASRACARPASRPGRAGGRRRGAPPGPRPRSRPGNDAAPPERRPGYPPRTDLRGAGSRPEPCGPRRSSRRRPHRCAAAARSRSAPEALARADQP